MTNYFELFGLQESFHPNQAEVKKKFFELSRQFHPDRFISGGSDAMDEALKMSALINQAYQTLKDQNAIMEYLLKYHGILTNEEKANLSPDFLMEMMELNEMISDAELDNNIQTISDAKATLDKHFENLEKKITPLTQAFDAGNKTQEILLQIKGFYFQKKYLLRIQERITKFALP